MTNSIFTESDYTSLQRDYDVLSSLMSHHGDKLAVDQGVLVISEGGFLQGPTRIVKNLLQGGYNRDSVSAYLQKLHEKTELFFGKLQTIPSCVATYPSEIRQFKRKIHQVALAISDQEYKYRFLKAFPGKDKTSEILSDLYQKFSNLHKCLKDGGLNNTPEGQKTKFEPKPIDFNAPINPSRIRLYLPAHQTVEDTLKLAKHAESKIIPLWKKIAGLALVFFLTILQMMPLGLLTFVKWVFWNPIELIVKGKITTNNPTSWWLDETVNTSMRYISDDAEEAVERYALQLVRTKYITDKHTSAFSELAKHVKKVELDLELGIIDLNELWTWIDNHAPHLAITNFGPYAQKAIEELLPLQSMIDPKVFQKFLEKHKNSLIWIDDNCPHPEDRKTFFLSKMVKSNPFIEDAKTHHKVEPHISPKNLLSIAEALGKSSKCESVKLEIDDPEVVKNLDATLKKHGFKLSSVPHTYVR